MSGITLLHCRTGAQGLDTELGIFCAPSTSGLSYSSYLHSRLVFNARCNASSFWWFFSACIMRCSRRGIYYQGNKVWRDNAETRIRSKSDNVAYHFWCTTRTGVHVSHCYLHIALFTLYYLQTTIYTLLFTHCTIYTLNSAVCAKLCRSSCNSWEHDAGLFNGPLQQQNTRCKGSSDQLVFAWLSICFCSSECLMGHLSGVCLPVR